MPFRTLLAELVGSIKGAEGAIFLESDGEAVQWCAPGDGEKLKLRAAYAAMAHRASRGAAERMGGQAASRLVLEYEGARLIVEEIDRNYILVVETSTSANMGEAIYRMRPAVATLRREL